MISKWLNGAAIVFTVLFSGFANAADHAKQTTLFLDQGPADLLAIEVTFPAGFHEIDEKIPDVATFVPKNQTLTNWTQKIELQEFQNFNRISNDYVNEMKARMKKESSSFEVLSEKDQEFPNYRMSEFTASVVENNKTELVIARFYSTTEFLSGYIYRTKEEGKIDQKRIKAAEDFIAKHIKLKSNK